MRAAPACQIAVRHLGVWRAAVGALFLLGVAATSAWLATREPPLGALWLAAAGSAVALAAVFARMLVRPAGEGLRWDGQCWHLQRGAAEPVAGALVVTIDLGNWMLLRFKPAFPATGTAWLPVQRWGLESQWHALRCAVRSPRPAPDASMAGEP